MTRPLAVVFVVAAFLGTQVESLIAQVSLDRRELNQPILLVDSESPTANVFALRFVRDGADGLRLLAAGEEKFVWQWQVRQEAQSQSVSLDPLPKLRWPINRGLRGMISSIATGRAHVADSSMVAFGGYGLLPTSVQLQSLDGKRALTSLHSDELPFLQNIVYGLEFWPEPSKLLAVGCGAAESEQAVILIWDVDQPMRPRDVLKTGFDAVRFLSVSPNGRSLVATDGVGLKVRRWSVRETDPFQTEAPVDVSVPSPVVGFTWQDDHHCLVATHKHGLISLDERPLDENTVSLVIRNRTPRPLTMATRRNGQNLQTWEVASKRSQSGTSPAVQQIGIRDGNNDWQTTDLDLGASPAWEFDVDLDASGRPRILACVRGKLFAQANGVIMGVKASLALNQSPPKRLDCIDVGHVDGNRPLLARLQESTNFEAITAVAVSPDGQFVAAVGKQPIQEIRLWRVSDGSLVAVTPDRRATPTGLSPIRSVGLARSEPSSTVPDVIRFSWSDNTRLSLSLSESMSRKLISKQTSGPDNPHPNRGPQSWTVRPDRDRFWMTNKSVEGQKVGPFPLLKWLSSEVLEAHRFVRKNGEYMAIGYPEGILIWDLAGLKALVNESTQRQEQALVRVFHRHTGRLSCLNVSEEGNYLITGTTDGSICLWSLRGIEQPHDGIRELGLKLRRDGNSLRVENFTPGLPAYFAGLQPNDELLKLRVSRGSSQESEWIEHANQMESALRALPPGSRAEFQVRGRPGISGALLLHEPLWTLYPMLDGQWVMSTPAQVFGASSDEAMRRFGWHLNLEGQHDQSVTFFPLDLFRDTHEGIAQIAQTSWKGQQPVVRTSSLELPSRVEITEIQAADGPRMSLTDEFARPVDLNVTLSVQRSGQEIPKQLALWCNGRLIRQENWEPPVDQPPTVRWSVPKSALRIGDRNQLIAVVRSDSAGNANHREGSPATLVNRAIRTIFVAGTPRPKIHFLGVGVTDLDHATRFQQTSAGIKPLRFAVNDVCLLGRALAERAGDSGFDLGEFRYLVPRVPDGIEISATQVAPPRHDEVLKALDRLRETAAPEDFVCVALSCHGFAADNGAYLVVQDTAPDFRDAVTDRELFADRLWKLNCPTLVLLDACHSGSALTGESLRGLSGFGLGPEILVSCKPRQESFEAERLYRLGDRWFGMSVFTASLLEALSGHELSGSSLADRRMNPVVYGPSIDRNGDSFLSVEELGLHATQRVPVLQKLVNQEAAALETRQQPDLLPSLAFPRDRIRLRIPSSR